MEANPWQPASSPQLRSAPLQDGLHVRVPLGRQGGLPVHPAGGEVPRHRHLSRTDKSLSAHMDFLMKTHATAVFSSRPPGAGTWVHCHGPRLLLHTQTRNPWHPPHPAALAKTPKLPGHPHHFPLAELNLSRQMAKLTSLTFIPRQRQRRPLLTWPPALAGLYFLILTGCLTTHSVLPGHGPPCAAGTCLHTTHVHIDWHIQHHFHNPN